MMSIIDVVVGIIHLRLTTLTRSSGKMRVEARQTAYSRCFRKLTYTGGLASHAQLQGGLAAFTMAELGEMLPDDLTIPSKNGKPQTHWLRFGRYRGAGHRFWCAYPGGTARTNLEERAHTEADARAT